MSQALHTPQTPPSRALAPPAEPARQGRRHENWGGEVTAINCMNLTVAECRVRGDALGALKTGDP